MNFSDIFPPATELLNMESEDVAYFLLKYLCVFQKNNSGREKFHQANVLSRDLFRDYCNDVRVQNAVRKAMSEAWAWLEKECLIAPDPDEGHNGWFFVARRGHQLLEKVNFDAYRKGHFLPREVLDEVLLKDAYPLFLRGDYDTAVFRAFKEVEVRVREKAGLPKELIGVDLMRKAFHRANGPLIDSEAEAGEKEAISNLFAGAIGTFKNPSSHRKVSFEDPGEVAEIILLANYLLRFVERIQMSAEGK